MADDLERARDRRRAADADVDTPNCPECLHPMEPRAFDIGEAWACPSCGALLHP